MVGSGVNRNWIGVRIAVITNWFGQCGGLLMAGQVFRLRPGISACARLARSAASMSLPSAISSGAVEAASSAGVAFCALAAQKSRKRARLVSATGVNVGKYVIA